MKKITDQIRAELKANSDEQTKHSGKRFFKEEVSLYGVKTAVVTKIANQYFKQIKDLPKQEIFDLCEEFWKSGTMEESFIACNWSYKLEKQYTKDDFQVFEKWVDQYIHNWASCDTLCNHSVGSLVEKFPHLIGELKRWAKTENKWMKRAAAVSLIIPARKGLFKKEIFEIADILLSDKEDLVQKGYGWMLKAASEASEEDVFQYVVSKKAIMPRTALRYSIEKMPKEKKVVAMEK